MANNGLWIVNPDTGEDEFVLYSELEHDVRQKVIKPIGGFIFDAETFMSSNLARVPFYIKDWLPMRGKAMFYAPPKSGKSYLAVQAARCIAAGEPFLSLPTQPGRVLYTQFELGVEVLQQRLLDTHQIYPDVFVGTSFSMKLDTEIGRKQLLAAMEAVKPKVLILDPMYKALSGDENESYDVMRILDFLDSLIEGYECSILLIHHSGKDPTKRGRGSSVLEDWVDSDIEVKVISKKGEPLKIRIQPIFLRHAAIPPEPIEAELSPAFEFECTTIRTVKQQVLEFITSAHTTVTPKELFDAKIGSNTSVYTELDALVKEGRIRKEGRGKYAI